jgi:hypothetical protein
MPTTSSFMAALVLVGMMAGAGYGGDLNSYLGEKEGRKALKEPLTLREEQGGIAGITGTVWTIEPSGQWRVAQFSPNKDGTERLKPVRSGTLSPADLESLARTLDAQDLAGLPERAGPEAKINPHRITLRFGQKTATLQGLPQARPNLSMAENIRKAATAIRGVDSAVWERFANVVHAVETHCQAAGQP